MKNVKTPAPTANGEQVTRQRYIEGVGKPIAEQASNFGVDSLKSVLGGGGEMAGGEMGGEYGVTPLKSS